LPVSAAIPSCSAAVTASAHVSGTRIEGSARAGIANFAATVVLADSELECNGIHLDGEPLTVPEGTFPSSFDDLGGNRCGCGDVRTACTVLMSNLEPPSTLP